MKPEATVVLRTETIELCMVLEKYWLWDFTQELNLSIRAETEESAFIEALEYYQKG